jgi:hypothetical protein
MPTFSIRRVVGDITRDEVDAAAIRSLWCLANFPEVHWIRSTWDAERGEINCLYEAPNVELIREHAVSAQLPCDEVREVDVIDPGDYVSPAAPVAATAGA